MYDVSGCGLSLFTNSFPFTMRTLHHPSNLGHLIPGSNPPNVLTLFTYNIYRLSYLHLIVFKIYLLARVAFKLISELCIEKDISPHHWKCAFHRKRYANAGHFVTTKIWNYWRPQRNLAKRNPQTTAYCSACQQSITTAPICIWIEECESLRTERHARWEIRNFPRLGNNGNAPACKHISLPTHRKQEKWCNINYSKKTCRFVWHDRALSSAISIIVCAIEVYQLPI